MKRIYLKTPYFNQLRKHRSKFCLQSPYFGVSVIQGEQIELCNAQQCITRQIVSINIYPLPKVPFFVLDNLGYTSRKQFESLVWGMFFEPDLDKIIVIELKDPLV